MFLPSSKESQLLISSASLSNVAWVSEDILTALRAWLMKTDVTSQELIGRWFLLPTNCILLQVLMSSCYEMFRIVLQRTVNIYEHMNIWTYEHVKLGWNRKFKLIEDPLKIVSPRLKGQLKIRIFLKKKRLEILSRIATPNLAFSLEFNRVQ